MNNLIYGRTSNALQIYDNFMEYTKWEQSVYRQTPEYTHGRQPTYMSYSVPRVFFVFDLANFYKE